MFVLVVSNIFYVKKQKQKAQIYHSNKKINHDLQTDTTNTKGYVKGCMISA